MSHELRTPLNSMGGCAQLIELGIRGPVTEQQRPDRERIQRSQTCLLSLIDDVLNFAKIESGHLSVECESAGVRECGSAGHLMRCARVVIAGYRGVPGSTW